MYGNPITIPPSSWQLSSHSAYAQPRYASVPMAAPPMTKRCHSGSGSDAETLVQTSVWARTAEALRGSGAAATRLLIEAWAWSEAAAMLELNMHTQAR